MLACLSPNYLRVLLSVLLLFSNAQILSADRNVSASGPVISHDYDPIADAVVSWRLRTGHALAQSFTTPGHEIRMTGFRMKVLRLGKPGDLEFALLDSTGQTELDAGKIPVDQISPFFEGWVGADLKSSQRLKPNTFYRLRLRFPAGQKSEDCYEVFGTASDSVESADFRPQFQYIAAWGANAKQLKEFENPLNVDYGAHTPVYRGGVAFVDGSAVAPLDFAFRVLAEGTPPDSTEEPFAFIRELDSPLHAKLIRDASVRPEKGEITLNADWVLEYPDRPSEVVKTAVQDFSRYMEKGMGVRIKVRAQKPELSASRTLILGTRADLPAFAADLDRPEAFLLDSSSGQRIIICGYDERGIMRGLQSLEDRMSLRWSPVIPAVRQIHRPLYSPRITSTPFYAKSELEVPVDPYTDNFLSRISHYGFNTIWIWGELVRVGKSSVYPELGNEVERRQARLREIAARAAKYGLDVHIYMGSQPLPASFFDRHPNVKGTPIKAYGGDFVLCTSTEESRRFIKEATQDLLRSVPQVTGISFIIGVEGLLHCYSRGNVDCPRCSRRSPQDVVTEVSRTVFEAAQAVNRKVDVAVWPYSANNTWSMGDTLQSQVIAALPPGLTWLTEFDKESAVSFGGITIPAYDYSISHPGPSERFAQQSRLAAERGLPLWAKSEHAISLELVQTPYIPVYSTWVERYLRLQEFKSLKGLFTNWQHYGFTPSIAAEICKWGTWASPSSIHDAASGHALLESIAARDYGAAAAVHAVRAWQTWSTTFKEYPFSGQMALGIIQKGPAHPFFFDSSYRPLQAAGRQFKNDLSWTRPWGPELALQQLKKVESGWSEGSGYWDKVVENADPALRQAAVREKGVSQAILFCLRSAISLGRFYQLREALDKQTHPAESLRLLDDMQSLLKAELENSRQALAVVRTDSRLGYANSGKGEQIGVPRAGIYSPGSIAKKIVQVERVLNEEIPKRRDHYRESK